MTVKLACIDKSASKRLELQKLVEAAFDSARDTIGHFLAVQLIPTSKEEMLIDSSLNRGSLHANRNQWSAAILGPGYSIEEIYGIAQEIKVLTENIPILCFLDTNQFLLKNLRRLENVVMEVFKTEDLPARIIHGILKATSRITAKSSGKIIAIDGVKGGQGATSIVVGCAHAAAAMGKSAIIIDLSKEGSLHKYLQTEKWQSTEYRTLITDRLNPTKPILDNLITEAPNGINILLPPSGGTEIRETWIRNPQTFEITLTILELLRERYDLVIIDLARAEGLLPFSILVRADIRVLITTNEPASIHLLNEKLGELSELPIKSKTVVVSNRLLKDGLRQSDIEFYLKSNEKILDVEVGSILFDQKAARWIGTGNSIYTEGDRSLKSMLKGLVSTFATGELLPIVFTEKQNSFKSLLNKVLRNKTTNSSEKKLLSAPQIEDVNFILTEELKESFRSVSNVKKERAVLQLKPERAYQALTLLASRAVGG